MTMNQEFKAKWIEALRSGKYPQAHNLLRTTSKTLPRGYCCLGVACELLGKDDEFFEKNLLFELSLPIDEETGTTGDERRLLSRMNDSGATFADIADYIEANL